MTLVAIVIAIAAAMATPFVFPGLHGWRLERTAELAARLGGGTVEAASARGTLGGVPVRLMVRSPNHGGLAVIARAAGAPRGVTLALRPRRPADATTPPAGAIAIGAADDPDFDRAFVVTGAPAAAVRAIFDAELRAAVRAVRLPWARLDGDGARVERPGFADRDLRHGDVDGDLAVGRLAAALVARAAAVGREPGARPDGGAYRDAGGDGADPAEVALPPCELDPRQIAKDEHHERDQLIASLALGGAAAAAVVFAWWAGVWF